MKIGNSSENTLITNTAASGRKYSIQSTGKAFQILSNALYQHKVKAVVREISCNAYDAHIDAGTTSTPFTVSLPCKEDPHFRVRDFGIGLAEDKFVEVYTTYFGSSKADSNDHTGGLGLGSKTPFIMSKTFTVHSYYQGQEYMWHSYVNDNGEPDVVLLSTKDTTEPNGLLVIVPIGQTQSETEQNALFREFQSEAQVIYKWFDVLPTVTCNGKPVTIKRELDSSGKYGKLKLTGMEDTSVYFEKDHSKTGQSTDVRIKMGNVVYPYKLSEVKSLDRFGGAVGHAERIVRYLTQTGRLNSNQHSLVIEVGMGDVDIAPSREALSLSNTTELTIINALVRFTDMFFDKVQTTIDTAKTTFEKYQALFAVPPMGGRKFKVDGKEIEPNSQNPVWAFGSTQAMLGRNNFLRSFSSEDLCVKYRRAGTRGIIPLNTSFDMSMYGTGIKERNVILIDKPYKGELRLWVNANTKSESSVVVVFGRDVKGAPIPMTDAEMAPFLEDAHPQVMKFSELTNVPAAAPAKTGFTSLKVTDDSMLVMGHTSDYNFFTQGNSSLEHLNKIKPIDPAVDVMDTLYICYKRQSSRIIAELQSTVAPKTATDPREIQEVEMAPWSRAQSSSGSWSSNCAALHGIFKNFAGEMLRQSGKTMLTFEAGGKKHNIKIIKHVVLNKEGYAAVVGNSDYPQFVTVDTAIKKLIYPLIPVDFHMYKIEDRTMYAPARERTFQTINSMLGLPAYEKYQADLEKKVNNGGNDAIRRFEQNGWVTARGYSPVTIGTTTHEYDFSENQFFTALISAQSAGIPNMDRVRHILKAHGGSLRDLFNGNTYYTEMPLKAYHKLAQTMLSEVNYKPNLLDDYLIQYYEKTHKQS